MLLYNNFLILTTFDNFYLVVNLNLTTINFNIMKDYHPICKRILNNIETLKILEDNNRNSNFQYKDSLNKLETCIQLLNKSETVLSSLLLQAENSLNSIKEDIKAKTSKSNSFVHDLIEADFLYIQSFYIHQTILTIANNINAYLRDDLSFNELKIEHLENFNPDEFEKTFQQENGKNKNKKIAQNLFNILLEVFNRYKLTNEKIKNILHRIE